MADWIHACSVDDLKREGVKLVQGGIAVFAQEDGIYAVDNRCPHMGFPLHMGSLCDGILTCHWHHARFDVCSGGTLDPWADDVPSHSVRIDNGEVYVNPSPKRKRDTSLHFARLREGLEQNISLIIAKAVVALLESGVPASDIIRSGVEFGTTHRRMGWGPGLTILTAMGNVLSHLDSYGQMLALFQGLVHVARDCDGQAPHIAQTPLPSTEVDMERLSSWYRQCLEVRDTDGAQRTLLTAIERAQREAELSDMMLAGATDHVYLDGGHTFDFHNKAIEVLELIGEAERKHVLASLVPLFRNPTRSEELQNWRAPVDLVSPMQRAFSALYLHDAASDVNPRDGAAATNLQASPSEDVSPTNDAPFEQIAFVEKVLGDDPEGTVTAITAALQSGVSAQKIAQCVAIAAAQRIARFHVQNDFADWIAVLHTFTHAHAVHERVRQGAAAPVRRAIYHSAMRIYLDRFLNIPSAPKPSSAAASQTGSTTDVKELLTLLDGRQHVAEAANWVAHYVHGGGDTAQLFNTLGHALLREDANFHTYQMYEAAVREYHHLSSERTEFADFARTTLLTALTRYLAAHAPTARELPHIARIAWRLHRGEKLFEAE